MIQLFCILTIFVTGTATATTPDVFPIEDLKRFRTDLGDFYPLTVCALKSLLGPEYEAMRKRAYEGGLTSYRAEWEKEAPEEGSVVDVYRHYQNSGNHVLWFHRSGAVVVGIRTADNKLLAFTNDGRRASDPPRAIRAWIEEGQADGLKVKWVRPSSDALQFPEQCRQEKLASELERYRLAKEGKSCDVKNLANLSFGQRPYLVLPPAGENAELLSSPYEAPAGKHPYLIAGDLVQVMQTDWKVTAINDRVCVFYRGAKNRLSLGWVAGGVLRGFSDSRSPEMDEWMRSLASANWFSRSHYRVNYPGKYKEDNRKIADTLHVTFKGSSIEVQMGMGGDPRVFEPGKFTAKLVNPRVARYEETFEGKPSQTASLYLFNNAIYVHLEDHTTRTNYWAIYYP